MGAGPSAVGDTAVARRSARFSTSQSGGWALLNGAENLLRTSVGSSIDSEALRSVFNLLDSTELELSDMDSTLEPPPPVQPEDGSRPRGGDRRDGGGAGAGAGGEGLSLAGTGAEYAHRSPGTTMSDRATTGQAAVASKLRQPAPRSVGPRNYALGGDGATVRTVHE